MRFILLNFKIAEAILLHIGKDVNLLWVHFYCPASEKLPVGRKANGKFYHAAV